DGDAAERPHTAIVAGGTGLGELSGMSLSGMLSMVPRQECLEWLQSGSKTGALELENEHFKKVLYFAEGMVVGINSNEPADSLVYRLQASGAVRVEHAHA